MDRKYHFYLHPSWYEDWLRPFMAGRLQPLRAAIRAGRLAGVRSMSILTQFRCFRLLLDQPSRSDLSMKPGI